MKLMRLNEKQTKYMIAEDTYVINEAIRIIEARLVTEGVSFTCPDDVKNYLRLKIGDQEREIFVCLWLNTRHELLKYEELFYGTVAGAAVYPREVVKSALACNASAVIFSHNHPSGNPSPSRDDEEITKTLDNALSLVDVRVLDHVIVSHNNATSFAERGLI